MARTVKEIQNDITTVYVNNMNAVGIVIDPTTWSVTNLQRLMIYVVAFCTWTLETLFDLHVIYVNDQLANLKPHTLKWYANAALAFQYGFSLVTDSDLFDNTGHTDDEIETSKVVDYAAVTEQNDSFGRVFLRIKLAHDNGEDLEPLDNDELTAFRDYMKRIKDAGVRLQIDSLPADNIRQEWNIYYDPLILKADGSRITDNEPTAVQDAIKNYLKNLPFNGVYAPQYHVDAVQAVSGVVLCEIVSNETKFGLYTFSQVGTTYTPDAGYLRFASDSDLTINFIAQSPIK